jgi:hypothetical protein
MQCGGTIAYFSKPLRTLAPVLHEAKYTGFIVGVEDFKIGAIRLSDDSIVAGPKGSKEGIDIRRVDGDSNMKAEAAVKKFI